MFCRYNKMAAIRWAALVLLLSLCASSSALSLEEFRSDYEYLQGEFSNALADANKINFLTNLIGGVTHGVLNFLDNATHVDVDTPVEVLIDDFKDLAARLQSFAEVSILRVCK
jgi:hypothetical protein